MPTGQARLIKRLWGNTQVFLTDRREMIIRAALHLNILTFSGS